MSLKICRLCLDENNLLSNIFDNQRKIQKHSLIECIEYISKIRITIHDQYSNLICHKCNYLVEQSFCFLRKIQLSNEILQQTDVMTFLNRKVKSAADANSMTDDAVEQPDQQNDIEELAEHLEEEEVSDENSVKEEYLLDDYNLIEELEDEKEVNETNGEDVLDDEESADQLEHINKVLKIANPSSPYKCEICLQQCHTSSFDQILAHLQIHTKIQNWTVTFSNKINLYFCDYCQANFNDISQLFIHLREHLNIRPFSCAYCSKKSSFLSESELMIHVQKQHQEATEIEASTYTCPYCAKKLNSSTSLKLHEKRHFETGSIKCDFCPKMFYFQSELKRHVQIHTGEKLFKCDICNKRFLSQPEVNRHRKYHTNERRFKCDLCDKSFIESGHLTGHRNIIHLNKKDFECKFCNKKFLTNFKLKRHQKSRSCEMISVLKNNQKQLVDDDLVTEHEPIADTESNDVKVGGTEETTTFDENGVDEPNSNSSCSSSSNLYTINNLFPANATVGRQFKVIGIHNGNEIQDYLVIDGTETGEELNSNRSNKDDHFDDGSNNGSTITNDVHHYVIDDVNSFINWDKVM